MEWVRRSMHAYRIHLRLGRLAAPASHSLRTMRYVKTRQGMSKQDEVRQIKARHVETKIAVGMLQNKLLTGHTPHHVLVDTNTCILITGNN
jgi:hypothetical protein